MIDKFSKKRFEETLSAIAYTNPQFSQWVEGWEYGEYVYSIPIDKDCKVVIRSSIDRSGYASDTGENSIRLQLQTTEGKMLGKLDGRWVTRVKGWNFRMIKAVLDLAKLREDSGNCLICGLPTGIYKVKKAGPNRGKLFARCLSDQRNHTWKWLD